MYFLISVFEERRTVPSDRLRPFFLRLEAVHFEFHAPDDDTAWKKNDAVGNDTNDNNIGDGAIKTRDSPR